MKKSIIFLLVTMLILAGCARTTETPPTQVQSQPPTNTALPPTDVPLPIATEVLPTDTPQPTPTEELPTLTPLPEGVLFRDDFEGYLQPGWQWENENPERWAFTDDGWLQIIGEYDSLLGSNPQSNLLWYPLPAGDFVITIHLKTLPFENFQQATLYIYENPDNYIAINRGFCGPCKTGGGGFYMEYKISGNVGAYMQATDAEDVYLRLENKDNMLSGYYSVEPDQWQRLGRFGNFFEFSKVGIGVSNVGAANDVVGLFDYFEISLP